MTLPHTESDLQRAARLIAACERDLGRTLTQGQMGDLIADNINDWDLAFITGVVTALNMTWGVGAFTMAEARKGAKS